MTKNLQASLASALSELYNNFHDDSEILHEAVAIVFSSIFRKFGIQCIVVGGQSAAYWMRMPGSNDIDFVSQNSSDLTSALELCGFNKTDFQFRFRHPETNILIELVDEQVNINGIRKAATIEVDPSEIDEPVVRSLMLGTAEVLDPVCVFLNYLEASSDESIWFDYKNQGALSVERAQALLSLYKNVIVTELQMLLSNGDIDIRLIKILHDKFQIAL